MSFTLGQSVTLSVPENLRLDRASAKIIELTKWGAHVACSAAATGRFRALFAEMEPNELSHEVLNRTTAMVESGYTGDVCSVCGSLRMRRTGTCSTCDDCGDNSGCG